MQLNNTKYHLLEVLVLHVLQAVQGCLVPPCLLGVLLDLVIPCLLCPQEDQGILEILELPAFPFHHVDLVGPFPLAVLRIPKKHLFPLNIQNISHIKILPKSFNLAWTAITFS